MKKYDLSVLIPARNEEFLARTVEDIVNKKRGNTEVLVGLDGVWANPPLEDHPDVTILYYPQSIGQRAITNQLCRLSNAKYVMKIDAHCIVDEGFDIKMMEAMQDDYTMVPSMYNLHAFDWVCPKCGNRTYQGPTLRKCLKDDCDGVPKRDMIWSPRWNRKSEFYRFDTTLHFQYDGARKKKVPAEDVLVESMSLQGSCFMLTRDKYWELNICDEEHGSWGQQGTEVACKTWLSGGRVVTNRNTWYSHLFRTQGGDFSFPYPQSGKQVERARQYSRDLFLNNKWDKQIYPLSWLIEKFWPATDWHDDEGKEALANVEKKGEEFYKSHPRLIDMYAANYVPKRAIIYYTDNQLNLKIAHACKKQIKSIGLPIYSASLKPMDDMGTNTHIKMQRGYMAYFTQILSAIESSEAEILYFCEHDWLYHPSHFDFIPPDKDAYYYNDNWWRVRASDGLSVTYETHLLPGLCGHRDLLLSHYKKRMERLLAGENSTKEILRMGFEPGTHGRPERVDNNKAEGFKSKYPLIDIRHDKNLTQSKWAVDQFRSPRNAKNWVEGGLELIPGWTDKSLDFRTWKPIV